MSRVPFKIALAEKLALIHSCMNESAELRADAHEVLIEIGDYDLDENQIKAIKLFTNFGIELYHIMNRDEVEFKNFLQFFNPQNIPQEIE